MNPGGEARLSKPASVRRRPWSLLGGAAIVFSLIFFRLSWEQNSYQAGGIRVQGVVTDKAYSPGLGAGVNARSGSFTSRYVMYRFTTTDGRTYDGKEDVLPELWGKLKVGDPVTIEYLTASPDTNQIPDQRAGTSTALIAALAGFLVGVALLAYGWWQQRAERKAARSDAERR